MGISRGGDTREAVACALRTFVHFSYEAEEREREEALDVDELRAFLKWSRIRIPCSNADVQRPAAWRDCCQVLFVDDRAESSGCAFGCVGGGCECVFDADLLSRCAALPPFEGICSHTDHHHRQGSGDIMIRKLNERILYFYSEVLRLPLLTQCLSASVSCKGTTATTQRVEPGSVASCAVALRALQWWSLSLVSPGDESQKARKGRRGLWLTLQERQQLADDVKSLIISETAEVLVAPLATAREHGSDGGQARWKGVARQRVCALEERAGGSGAVLHTSDFQFRRRYEMVDALACLVLLRAREAEGLEWGSLLERRCRLREVAAKEMTMALAGLAAGHALYV